MSKKDVKAGGAFVELATKDVGFHEKFAKAKDKMMAFAAAVVSVRGVVDGAKAVFSALSAPVKQFIETGNSLEKMSQQTGLSVEALSKLKYAADQSEVSMDAITQAMVHMRSKRIDPAQFDELAASVAAIEDPLLRAQEASRVFGASGEALLPMLGNLESLQAEAEKLGLVMGGDAAASAAHLKDVLASLWATLQQGMQAIGAAVAPFLEVAIPAIQAFATVAINQIKAAGDFIIQNVSTVTNFISAAWQGYYNYIAPILGAYKTSPSTRSTRFGRTCRAASTSIQSVVSSVWGNVAESTGSVVQWMQDAVIGVLKSISFAFKNWRTILSTALVSAELAIVRFANQTIHFFSEVIPGWLSWFGENWTDVFTDVASITATIAANIWENLKNLWDAIKGLFTGEGFAFEWTALTAGFESAVKEWPKIAEREMGPLERSLQAELDGLGAKLTDEWERHGKEFAASVAKFTPADEIGNLVREATGAAAAKKEQLAAATPNAKAMAGSVMGSFNAAALMAQGQGGGSGFDRVERAVKAAAKERKEQNAELVRAVKEKGKLGA